ncbi:MAG: hypothetical protein NTU88_09975 [Armatimonadetes bacterium]|nr:hypothetical protein [Armatimonadota bacterium]
MGETGRALVKLDRWLKGLKKRTAGRTSRAWQRQYYAVLRDILRLYEDTVSGRDPRRLVSTRELGLLRRLAARAFDELGGQAEPAHCSLKNYNRERFGPYLGVSGEGNAAPAIVAAARLSPKVRALGISEPIEIGMAHDAERLGSVGELPVGPDDYRDIRLQCKGHILTSTNIGARLNLRFYRRLPVIWVNEGDLRTMFEAARHQAAELVAPFLRTPDRRPRPVTVYVQFRARVPHGSRIRVFKMLSRAFEKGEIADPKLHRLGLLARVRRGSRGVSDAIEAIELAHDSGIAAVAVEGIVRAAAEDLVSVPGLLQYFSPRDSQKLLETARVHRVLFTTKNVVDTESMARHAWTGLTVARGMGLELGKYGLFPLTFEESDFVVRCTQRWFRSWTAAPAFYVDVPTITASRVFTSREAPEAVRTWLKMVARHGVRVVLIDTVDKSKGRRLMKLNRRDAKGILLRDEIRALDRFALKLGINTLWAGGITIDQVFEFGRMGVFGIYVTTAATTTKPVSPSHERDISLATERVPTGQNVYRVKLLLEAGFLSERLIADREDSRAIDEAARLLLEHLKSGSGARAATINAAVKRLDKLVLEGWRVYRRKKPSSKKWRTKCVS